MNFSGFGTAFGLRDLIDLPAGMSKFLWEGLCFQKNNYFRAAAWFN
jgi:hypothetical protein